MSVDSHTADRMTGLVLLMLGIAMLVGGFTMDRLEIRQIHPASIPGLVPMGLGVAMIICSVLLIVSAQARANTQASEATANEKPGSFKNLFVTAVLCIAYAVGLLGKMPFLVATAIFIFLFSAIFNESDKRFAHPARLKQLFLIALFAVVFASGISVLFQYGFLVRLP